jgi:signal transduction histidine kinase
MLQHYFDLCAAESSNRAILLMEEERHRLARELHDDLLQILTALGLRLDLCRQLSNKNDHAALEVELARLKSCWERSLDALRQLDAGASGYVPENDSLAEAISCLADWYEEQTGIEVGLNLEHLPESELSTGQRGTLLRILQEALRNVQQHASASCILIWAQNSADAVRVRVEDDGVGFNLSRVTSEYPLEGLGLAGMVEGARAEGGQLLIDSKPGRGTSLTLILPLGTPRED